MSKRTDQLARVPLAERRRSNDVSRGGAGRAKMAREMRELVYGEQAYPRKPHDFELKSQAIIGKAGQSMKRKQWNGWGLVILSAATFASAPNPTRRTMGLGLWRSSSSKNARKAWWRGISIANGRRDVLLIDNSHSRLDLLLQRAEKPDKDDPIDSTDVNAIKYDWRFEYKQVPVDKEVSSVAAGDFNHDGKDDIAYFGVPDRLIVRTQGEGTDWPDCSTSGSPMCPNRLG